MAVSAKNYRFISPGIVTQEIDRSRIPNAPLPIGPVIIGRAERGPAFTPVTISSFADFVNAFGNPVAGGNGGDVWREGNKTSPMYGTYAAQSWLKNGEVLTYVRTLGVQSQNASVSGYAGWKMGSVDVAGTTGGAYGLFVFPSGTLSGESFTGSLAAVWYMENSSGLEVPYLSGTLAGTANTAIAGTNTLIKSDANGNFNVYFSGAPSTIYNFSLDKSKNNFIRKIFNTDPTLVGRTNSTLGQVSYFLGETFEDNLFRGNSTSLNSSFTASLAASNTQFYGYIGGLKSGSYDYSDRQIGALTSTSLPRSGWIISQDTNQNTGSFIVTGSNGVVTSSIFNRVAKLFRFVGLNTGEWLQNNLKLSVVNIQPPVNENVDPYATFDVQLRLINDSDKSVKIVESFTGCTLNAKSDSFIMAKIGDKYVDYDEINQRLREYGSYENKSKYVRVEMAPGLENGTSTLVPFGITLPSRLATFTATSGSVSSGSWVVNGSSIKGAPAGFYISASINPAGYKISFPSVPFRTTTSTLNSPAQAYWGTYTTQDSGEIYTPAIKDTLFIKPVGFENYDLSESTEYSNLITLDNVRYDPSATTISPFTTNLTYDNGARAAGRSLTSTSSLPTGFPQASSVSGTYKAPLLVGANKFTTLFYGGTDGFDIKQSDPLRNNAIALNDPLESYEYFTYQRAIDTIKNPEIAQYNLVSIPGLTNSSLLNRMVNNTQQRADSLAVLDVPNSYVPPAEYLYQTGVTQSMGDVNSAVDAWKNTYAFNSSYGCAYYPWVQIRDNVNGTNVWVPPSVVALGAMAYTDVVQAPWFAPAGFNRGGLSSGIAGLPVLNTALKLFQGDRDNLYNVNINPIASFPNEGIVIFGQKTLQVEKSALDRINVRRLLIYVKTGISRIAASVLFEQNVQDTWNRFIAQAEPFLADVKARFGLTDYKFVLDNTTTTPELIDQNMLYAKVYLKPARAIEFIALDFIITNTGASFED